MRRMMRGRKVTNCRKAWEYPAWLHFMMQITLNKNKKSDYLGVRSALYVDLRLG